MGRYDGKRTRRPGLMALAFGTLAATVALCVGLVAVLRGGAEVYLPWLGIGGMVAFYVLMVRAFAARPATLDVGRGEVRVSWRADSISVRSVRTGRWVLASLDTPTGMLLEIEDQDGRRLWIGGDAHLGRGYPRDAGPRRSVDMVLGRADFDRLAAELGVTPAPDAAQLVELVQSSQSAGGLLRTMGPWFLTMAVVCTVGVTLGVSGVGERLPPLVLGGGTTALVVGGLIWTVVRSTRVRDPAIVLELRASGLTISEPARKSPVAVVPWSAVRARARDYTLRMKGSSWTMPALELSVGERTLELTAWGAASPWPRGTPALRRAPRLLAGHGQFQALVDELHRRGVMA